MNVQRIDLSAFLVGGKDNVASNEGVAACSGPIQDDRDGSGIFGVELEVSADLNARMISGHIAD